MKQGIHRRKHENGRFQASQERRKAHVKDFFLLPTGNQGVMTSSPAFSCLLD